MVRGGMIGRDPLLAAKELGLELRKRIALTLASQGDDSVAFLKACQEIDELRAKCNAPLHTSGDIRPQGLGSLD